MCLRFDKTFLFQNYEYFCRSTQIKIVSKTFFLMKRKGIFFGEWQTQSFRY